LREIYNYNDILEKINYKEKMENLSMHFCRIYDDNLSYIFNNFLNLKILKLDYIESSLSDIKKLKMLTYLSITINGNNLKYLCEIKKLRILCLTLCFGVDDDNIQYLGKFKNLTSITLDDPYLSDSCDHIRYICQNEFLVSVTLRNICLTNRSIDILIRKNLKKLYMSTCPSIGRKYYLECFKDSIERIKYLDLKMKCFSWNLDDNAWTTINYLKNNIEKFNFESFDPFKLNLMD
jgi:hypothetical protein